MAWAFFWCLYFPLHQPEGLAPLIQEVDAARIAWQTSNPSVDLSKPDDLYDFLSKAPLPLVDATISEMLRLMTSASSMRIVQGDDVPVGRYTLQKGDQVICASRYVHLNEDIYSDMETFRPGRFLAGDGHEASAKRHLLAFGGGVSLVGCSSIARQRSTTEVIVMTVRREGVRSPRHTGLDGLIPPAPRHAISLNCPDVEARA